MLLRVIRCAFAMRRKTMANNLQAAFALSKADAAACIATAGLPAPVRGEALGIAAYAALADAVRALRSPGAAPSPKEAVKP